MKNVFTIEPDTPFLDALASEIWRLSEGDGFRLSQFLILLPTRRACRNLGAVFSRIANGKSVLLPRMRPLGESDEDELIFSEATEFDIPPAISPLKRLMLLTQQVQKRDPTLSWDQAALAADALTRFLDQIQIEKCDTSQLSSLVEEQELSDHWQKIIAFLDIVIKNWPLILAEHGCLDPAERRNAVLKAQADLWRQFPPTFPIIAAGSTGSVPATADLLNVIADLSTGAVILPGLDRDIDNEAWDEVEEAHPQHTMKKLIKKMGVERKDVRTWNGSTKKQSPRVKLLSEAARPAGSTEAWRELNGKIDEAAVSGLTRLELTHPQEEAQVIAMRLRSLLEEKEKTGVLVTADRNLAMRVAALLRRWGVEVDDSGGTPLAMLPIGAFLNLTLSAATPFAGSIDILSLLKHPYAACGLSPALCRINSREAEMNVRKNMDENFDQLRTLLQPLLDNWHRSHSLSHHIMTHISVAEAIAASDTETGANRLWQGESGADAAAWLDEWREAAQNFPDLSGSDYAALFTSLSATKVLRSARTTHPRLSILGPLEARLVDADLIILGGMNEGVWPPDVGFDPWMSRPMRKKFELPAPELRIGLSAHDFVQLASAGNVMLTRSQRINGTPSVPSRLLLQIDVVLQAAGLSRGAHDALAAKVPWREWAHALDTPQTIQPCARPTPCPPLQYRPKTLSVTEITTWLRNPYAIYAKHVLKLNKLEELDAELDASDRGTMIHEALEKFIRSYPDKLPENAEDELLEIGRLVFSQDHENPRVRAFWWARFVDIASWFIEQEKTRRSQNILTLAAEPKGSILIDKLTLKGRADRIDQLSDGRLSIVDYKTGATPSKAEVLSGLEPQLQLLAFIAQKGGFADISARESGSVDYWSLKGGSGGCKVTSFTTEIPDLIAQAEAGLKTLIATFARAETVYEAVPKSRLGSKYNDYAHLSRLAEWGRGTGES